MRITSKMMFEQAEGAMMKRQEAVLDAHERVVSGKKILKPSDDPAGANKVMGYRSLLSSVDQYERNIAIVQSRLDITETALKSASDVVQALKGLAIGQSAGTATAEERKNAAVIAQNWRDTLVGIANTKAEGGYIFGGYAANAAPFDANGNTTGTISGEIDARIGNGVKIKANITGDRVFKGAVTYGTTDIFTSINNLITALNANDTAGINTAIIDLAYGEAQIVNARTDVAGRQGMASGVKESLAGFKLTTTNSLSKEEDVDMATAITDFTAKQQSLEAAQMAAKRLFEMPTLMDFLK